MTITQTSSDSASHDPNAMRPDASTDWFASVMSVDGHRRSLVDEMIRRPYGFDFFQALRRVESLTPFLPRIGFATRADQELIRIGQSVHLDFAPATIEEVSWTDAGRLRMQQRFFGLWGPSGALPLPMTESARDQWRHDGDRTQIAFADLFHHRMATLLYRVWSTSRGAIQRDRPDEDRFADHVASLAGIHVPRKQRARRILSPENTPRIEPTALAVDGDPNRQVPQPLSSIGSSVQQTGSHDDAASAVTDLRRFHAARFGVRRNADGLQDLLSGAFGVKVDVRTFVPTSLQLREEDHACLGQSRDRSRTQNTLGGGLVLGRRIEDRASTIELTMGPLDLVTYRSLMPGAAGHQALSRLARGYAGRGLQIQVRLILQKRQTPTMCLGKSSTIGRDSWLSADRNVSDANDYRFSL